MPATWALLTGEYPPQFGGVADYTFLVAEALAKSGDTVHVWSSPCSQPSPVLPGVTLHRLTDHFGLRGLIELSRGLAAIPSAQVVVQYTPHAFGFKGLNLPFALWLNQRRGRYSVMFHEVAYPFVPGQPFRHRILAHVTHLMARLIALQASHIFVSIQGWEPMLRQITQRLPPCHWLPVPTNVARTPNHSDVAAIRGRLSPDAQVIGHFGTYQVGIAKMLTSVLVPLLSADSRRLAYLVGHGSDRFVTEFILAYPHLRDQLLPTGALSAVDVASHLSACDLLVQPYPDGACTRRGSLMAGLGLGLPIVTTLGKFSDTVFFETDAVHLSADTSPQQMVSLVEKLLNNPCERLRLREASSLFYDRYCSVNSVVSVMQGHI
jgi:glycosyltransferase involved in cell wall biosynthesis